MSDERILGELLRQIDSLQRQVNDLGAADNGGGGTADIAATIHAATAKTTPADADEFGGTDSAASYVLKKFTWSSVKATLKTYFDALYAGITHASRHASGGADALSLAAEQITSGTLAAARLPHGTSFPASPATYDRYFRDDLGVECFYDGTRWLGPPQFAAFPIYNGYPPFSASAAPYVLALTGAIYIDKFTLAAAVATPNNASNYWSFNLYRDTTSIWTDATDDRTAGNIGFSSTTLGAQNASIYYYIAATKVGSPGALYMSISFDFRRIYT